MKAHLDALNSVDRVFEAIESILAGKVGDIPGGLKMLMQQTERFAALSADLRCEPCGVFVEKPGDFCTECVSEFSQMGDGDHDDLLPAGEVWGDR